MSSAGPVDTAGRPVSMRRRFDQVFLAAAVGLHLAVLYWPRAPAVGGTLPIDKVVHVAIFALVLWAAVRAGVRLRLAAAVLAGHAVVSELIQHYALAGRSGDPWDVVANLVGVLIVTALRWRRG